MTPKFTLHPLASTVALLSVFFSQAQAQTTDQSAFQALVGGVEYIKILPSDLGIGLNQSNVSGTYDISHMHTDTAGNPLAPGSVVISLTNTHTSNGDVFTVNNSSFQSTNNQGSTSFSEGSIQQYAAVLHGRNLGDDTFNTNKTGPGSRDGIETTTGENWVFDSQFSNLNTNVYDDRRDAATNRMWVQWIGGDSKTSRSNPQHFVWASEDTVTDFRAFSNNNTKFNNNYILYSGIVRPDAVPEPGTLALLGLGATMLLRRKR